MTTIASIAIYLERHGWTKEVAGEKDFDAALQAIKLAANGYAYLISTLELIIENGNNRLLSIRAIMKSEGIGLRSARRRYERQRQALLEIFDVA